LVITFYDSAFTFTGLLTDVGKLTANSFREPWCRILGGPQQPLTLLLCEPGHPECGDEVSRKTTDAIGMLHEVVGHLARLPLSDEFVKMSSKHEKERSVLDATLSQK